MSAEETTERENESEPSRGTRKYNIQFIKTNLVPALDSSEWQKEYSPTNSEVDKSATILAEEYYDMAVPAVCSFLTIILLLLLIDYLLFLDSQVYGLFISIWSSIVMVFPSLKGRYVIATAVEGKSNKAIHRLEAQEVVTANVGFFILAIGFIFQLFSVQFLTSNEFIQANQLVNQIPQLESLALWITLGMFIITGIASSKVISIMRSKRLESRKTNRE